MPTCKQCGEVYGILDMAEDGICKNCFNPELSNQHKIQREKREEFEANKISILNTITTSSEATVDIIEKRLGLVTAQYVEGSNLFKDISTAVRDIWGGRVKSMEDMLYKAQKTLIDELKEKSFILGGNGVVGIKIEHTYNNAGGGTIISLIASGTAVKLKTENKSSTQSN